MTAQQREFENEVVYPYDLIDRASGSAILDGYVFRSCIIRGPALLYFPPIGNQLGSIHMNVEDIESALFEIQHRPDIVGAICFTNSTFEDCTFEGIGITGHYLDMRIWRTAKPKQDG